MLKDITIGQYYPTNSMLHSLDPRTKIIGTMVFIISLFLSRSVIAYGIITICLIAIIALSKVPFSFIIKGLKPVLFLLIFSVGLNIFFTPGDPLIKWGFFTITKEGVIFAAFIAVRLIYLIIGSSLLSLMTLPMDFTDGLERLFSPLKILRVPVHEIAMMMSIALRFIPILTEELEKIMKAQAARGADFNRGTLKEKMKSLVPIIVPLFVSAIRRSNDLAMAMEARCYHGGKGRTKMKPLCYKKGDYIAHSIFIVYIIMILCIKLYQMG